jgi:hypothetical protein
VPTHRTSGAPSQTQVVMWGWVQVLRPEAEARAEFPSKFARAPPGSLFSSYWVRWVTPRARWVTTLRARWVTLRAR